MPAILRRAHIEEISDGVVSVANPDVSQNQKTYLTSAITPTGDSQTLSVTNNAGFAADDYILLGKISEEKTELIPISSVSGNTKIDCTPSFSHPVDTPVSLLGSNQVKIYSATSKGGTYSLVATISITPDHETTNYTDTAWTSSKYYKASFYNSTTATESPFSGEVPASGYSKYSRRKIADRILSVLRDEYSHRFKREDINDWIDEFHELIFATVLGVDEEFLLKNTGELSTASELNDLPVDCKAVKRAWYTPSGSTLYEARRMRIQDDFPDAVYDSSSPRYSFQADQIGFKPVPTSGKYRLVYEMVTPSLTDDAEELPIVFRSYTLGYVNYGLYRAGQAEGKIAKDAPIPSSVASILGRIAQDISQRNTDWSERVEDVLGTYEEVLDD